MAFVMDELSIAVLPKDSAWENYNVSLIYSECEQFTDATRYRYDQVARKSLAQYFRHIDNDPTVIPYAISTAGAHLDKRRRP